MTTSQNDITKYRLERAIETLEEAKTMLQNGHTNAFVNRLYYACFYSVSAWLALNDLVSSKHSGVRALMHQKLVKHGIISIEQGILYDRLFNNRQKGDYVDFVHFNAEEVAPWLDEAKMFVETINSLIYWEDRDIPDSAPRFAQFKD